MPRAGTFRLKGSAFFLTYPQTPHNVATDLITFFKSIRHYQGCVIGKELHEDGSEHLHALVQFSRQIDSTRTTFFDVAGRHPNIQVARRPTDVYNYVVKDNNYITDGRLSRIGQKKESYEEAIQEAITKESYKEAVDYLWTACPATFTRNYSNITRAFRDRYGEKDEPYVSPYTFTTIPQEISDWVEKNCESVGRLVHLTARGQGPSPPVWDLICLEWLLMGFCFL